MTDVFSSAVLVILGWLLGTLSPGIGRAIQRSKRRGELLRGLSYECGELRFTVATLLFTTRQSLLALDQQTLDLVKPILVSYSGSYDHDLVTEIRKLFALGDASLIAISNNEKNLKRDESGHPIVTWPAPYSLPFLATHLGEIDLLPTTTQQQLLRIDAELKLFNNQVDYIRHLLDRSFLVTGPNHQLNASNLAVARKNFAERCEVLVRAINGFLTNDARG